MDKVLNITILAVCAFFLQVLIDKIAAKAGNPYEGKRIMISRFGAVLLWILLYLKYGLNPNIVMIMLVFSMLVSITIVDFKDYEIPNEFSFAIFILGLSFSIFNFISNALPLKIFLLGAIISFVFYFILMIISGGNLGGGDVKLATGLGFFLTTQNLMSSILYTFMAGGVISLVLLLLKIKKKEDKIAFGPYICLAFVMNFLI